MTITSALPAGPRHSSWFRNGITLALLMMSATACSATGDREPLRLRIGVTQWPGFDILHHARKERLFEKRGLSVQWMSFDNQQDSARAMVLGSLDACFVSMWDAIQIDAAKDSPAFILVTNVSRGSDGIVTRPGISSISELRGKRIATKLGTVNQLILIEALKLHGMTTGDVDIVDIDNELAERWMYEGNLDAAATWEPTLSRVAARTGGAIVYTTREVDSLVVDGLVTSRKVLREKREAMIRLLLVWLDIMHDLETRPDQVYANAGAAIGLDMETFTRDYAGLGRGDRAMNEQMFGQGRLQRTLQAQVELIRSLPFGSTVRAEVILDAEYLEAALARWRPPASAGPPE